MLILPVLLLLCHGARLMVLKFMSTAVMCFHSSLSRETSPVIQGRALCSWNASTPLCQWSGVSCSSWMRSGCSTRLDLGGHGLSGVISHHVGNLTSDYLSTWRWSCSYWGSRSSSLNETRALRVLGKKYLTMVTELNLSSNTLSGKPPHLNHLRKLDGSSSGRQHTAWYDSWYACKLLQSQIVESLWKFSVRWDPSRGECPVKLLGLSASA